MPLTSQRTSPSVLLTQRYRGNHLHISNRAGNFSAKTPLLWGKLYRQPGASFPSLGPLGQPSKPAAVIANRGPLGWPTHLAVCPLLLPCCLSYLRVLSFSLYWGCEPTIQSQLGLHIANLSKCWWQRIHLTPVGLSIQQPKFVPAALYGSLGDSLVCHNRAAWVRKGSRCDACPLLQMRGHLAWKALLWVSYSWDLGKGSVVYTSNCIHFQLAKTEG